MLVFEKFCAGKWMTPNYRRFRTTKTNAMEVAGSSACPPSSICFNEYAWTKGSFI